jgi:hypothetical protein
MEKTIKEWIEEAEEPYRTQMLNNTSEDTLKDKAESLLDALYGAFIWENSPEEHEYWSNYKNTLLEEDENN